MKKVTLLLFILVVLCYCTPKEQSQSAQLPSINPVPVSETHFGMELTDDYRNLEDLKDTNVVNWMKAQADYARSFLDNIPGRQGLIDKMVEFDARSSSKISYLNITENNLYFYLKTTPEDETGILYYRDGYEGEEIFLFDPMKYDKEGKQKFTISSLSPSVNGEKIVIEVAPDGSENSDLLIMNVAEKSLYPEKIDRIWFGSASWLPDARGFFYNRMRSNDVHDMERELNTQVFFHTVGTDPSKDKEILSSTNNPELNIKPREIPLLIYDKDSQHAFALLLTVDSRLVIYRCKSNEIFNDKVNWKSTTTKEDEIYNINLTDKDFYLFTPKDAPNFKILKTSINNPDIANAETIVAEDKSRVISSYTITSNDLYYTLSENGVSEKVFRKSLKDGSTEELNLPFAAGTAYISSRGFKFSDIWISIAGWSSSNKRFRYNPESKVFNDENLSDIAEFPEYDNLVVEEVMAPSHDGTNVPLSLIYNKDLVKDGNAPVYMFGYGAYGASMNPFFSPNRLLITLNGGIMAVAHVRGGGEMGDAWYKAGYKTTKPNTWKDLIACAEYLIDNNYSSPQKISINSASAGGILVGRAITERPDLFAAAVPEVGCMNPMRQEFSPNGPVNIPEFGTVEDSVECMALLEMDSYHHLVKGENYPATLITAGMNDPRVIAWQPAKFAAKMQDYNSSDQPILFLTDFAAGHGIGDTKTTQFKSWADILSFSLWQTGHPDFQID